MGHLLQRLSFLHIDGLDRVSILLDCLGLLGLYFVGDAVQVRTLLCQIVNGGLRVDIMGQNVLLVDPLSIGIFQILHSNLAVGHILNLHFGLQRLLV